MLPTEDLLYWAGHNRHGPQLGLDRESDRQVRGVVPEPGVVRVHAVDVISELVRDEGEAVDQMQVRIGGRPLLDDRRDPAGTAQRRLRRMPCDYRSYSEPP